MKKVNCCICDTLFQLFTCLNMFYGQNDDSVTDLFLGTIFQDKKYILDGLKEAKVFRGIYYFDSVEEEMSVLSAMTNKFQRIVNP